jgi:hypothetical protein
MSRQRAGRGIQMWLLYGVCGDDSRKRILVGLGMCISPLAVLFLWLINTFLFGLSMLLPSVCGFNPRGAGRAAG